MMVSVYIETNGGLVIGILEDIKQRRVEKMNNYIYRLKIIVMKSKCEFSMCKSLLK